MSQGEQEQAKPLEQSPLQRVIVIFGQTGTHTLQKMIADVLGRPPIDIGLRDPDTLTDILNPTAQLSGSAPAKALAEQLRRLSIAREGVGEDPLTLDLASPIRLVPDQTPARVLLQLRKHLDDHGFKDVHVQFLGGESPGRTDPDHPFLAMVRKTAEGVFEKPMRLAPMVGGSGPNHIFIHELGVPIATAGLGYPDTRAHAPNENIRIDLYTKHAKHMARLIHEFSQS